MTNDHRLTPDNPLLEPSFADAVCAIESAENLTAQHKTHWCSSLRQIGQALGMPLETLPARWTSVRFKISALHHALAGCREKTLQNHKANVRRALLWLRNEHDVAPRGVPISAEWQRLLDRIKDAGVKHRLSGLLRYCSGKGIAPHQVSESTLDGYMAYRGSTTRLSANAAARRQIARAWNGCAATVIGWPPQKLLEPPLLTQAGPTWEDFPVGLRLDIEHHLHGLTKMRRSARGKRLRPCKPSTIRTRRMELIAFTKQAATIVPLESLTSFTELLKPTLVEKVLDAYWKKHGETPGIFVIELAAKLVSIARQIGMDEAELEQLDELRSQLDTYKPSGLTPKNRTLIRQVLNPAVWRNILTLPTRLMEEARRVEEHAPVKAAVTAQIAVAIATLSFAPIRLGNLGRIRLGENLIRPGGVDGPYHLVFPDYDVKNNVPLEFELDQGLTRLIDEYVDDFRVALSRGSNEPWLFPGETCGHKGLTTLGAQIGERILDATGVQMTPHQFRHAAAAILLKSRPGEYELVRRLLGHRNIQTTINFYCGLETTEATRVYGVILRNALSPQGEGAT